MASSPKASQSPPIRSSRRHVGVSPAYQFRIGSCQAIVRVSPLGCAGASSVPTAILGAA